MRSSSSDSSKHSPSTPSIARSTVLMTIGTLLSRVTGLARTWVMAYVLGAGMLASAYQVSNNLPNIIYEAIAGGMIAAAFLPVLMLVAEKQGKEAEVRYASNILNIVAVVLGAISLGGIFLAEPLIATQTFTVDSQDEVVSTAVWLFRIFSVQVLFYGLSGVLQGMLNANRTFFITAIAPALNNITVIAAFIAFALISPTDSKLALTVLAIGTTFGVIVQFAVQIPAIRAQGFSWKPVFDLRDDAIRETVKIAIPTVIFVIASIVGQSVRNAFALGASPSGPAMIAYAWMWFQLPYGVIAVSLSRALFTEMSDSASKGAGDELVTLVSRGLNQTLCLMIPCAFCLIALSTPIIGLFQSGAFTSADTVTVSGLLCLWVIGLPMFSIWSYLYNAFASIRKFMPFALLNVVLISFEIPLYWALSSSPLGLYGIPISDVIYYSAYALGSIVLAKWAIRRFFGMKEKISFFGNKDMLDLSKMVLAGIIALAACWVLLPVIPDGGTLLSLAKVCFGGIASVTIIIAVSYTLKVTTITRIIDAIFARIRKKNLDEGEPNAGHDD